MAIYDQTGCVDHEENHPSKRKQAVLILFYAILAFSTASLFSLWTGSRNPNHWMLFLDGLLFTVTLVVTAMIQFIIPTERCLRLATAALGIGMLMMGYAFMNHGESLPGTGTHSAPSPGCPPWLAVDLFLIFSITIRLRAGLMSVFCYCGC